MPNDEKPIQNLPEIVCLTKFAPGWFHVMLLATLIMQDLHSRHMA
jgi:hypothetical protein